MAEDDGKRLSIAIIHPDLGIGGAERLIVDAALGLQKLGHSVDIFTSHHDPKHCFEETRDGSLQVHYIRPPFPRSIRGKLHIIFAILRQLHLTLTLLLNPPVKKVFDVYLVDQLSTCIPLLKWSTGKSVVFYCHFPDKLLAGGKAAVVDADAPQNKNKSLWKRIYRGPIDWVEEVTTDQADIILANSEFTARVFKQSFPSIRQIPRVVYPGINIDAYEHPGHISEEDELEIKSNRPTFISLNRFEQKKNVALAIKAFAKLCDRLGEKASDLRLVLAGGYDPRLQDNITTLTSLRNLCTTLFLPYKILTSLPLPSPPPPPPPTTPSVLFILNFTTSLRTLLLTSPSTLALLYTPTNEHFGIGPLEGMICGLPVLACDNGGPTESVDPITLPSQSGTGWLRREDPEEWMEAMEEIVGLSRERRAEISERAKERVKRRFGMGVMCAGLEGALKEAEGLRRRGGERGKWSGWTEGLVWFLGGLVLYWIWEVWIR